MTRNGETADSATASDDTGSGTYAALMLQLVTDQDARKASIEQRALAVVTTSGTLVTLLFGLVALLSKSNDYEMPRAAEGPLGIGAGLLVVAAVLALATNAPLPGYKNADDDGLDPIFDRYWKESKIDAELRVAVMRKGIYAAASRMNGVKAKLLIAAMTFEVAGVLAIALAIREVIVAS
jgi:hypothetical protein